MLDFGLDEAGDGCQECRAGRGEGALAVAEGKESVAPMVVPLFERGDAARAAPRSYYARWMSLFDKL